jgi:AraC-like DNA-binding protein
MENNMHFQLIEPEESLSDFIYCFSAMQSFSNQHEAVIIPNGNVDLIFSKIKDNQLRVALLGLETKPKYTNQEVIDFYSVSFHPLAIEYLFKDGIADILNSGKILPAGFWDIKFEDLNDFGTFCKMITAKIRSLLPEKIDDRKRNLFKLIFDSRGQIPVSQLAEKVMWSERQINRYFKGQFGLSVKAYCKIHRFQASLDHIRHGKLHPQLNFTDQSHFIKEIKQFSGVSPKELYKNENYRFLQFLVYEGD